MNLVITSSTFGSIPFEPVLPQDYKGILLPGARVFSSIGEYGSMLIQQIATKDFSLRYYCYNILKGIKFHAKLEDKGLISRVMLKNTITHSINHLGLVELASNEFCMVLSNFAEGSCKLAKDQQYELIDAFYSSSLLMELKDYFPEIMRYFSEVSRGTAKVLQPIPGNTSVAMTELFNQLVHCQHEGPMQAFFYENKIRELLFLMITQYQQPTESFDLLSRKDLEAVHAARQLIVQDISKHYSIEQVSKHVGLNVQKLKFAFKACFKMGVFEYLMQVRMETARTQILTTTLPLKRIAADVGYEFVTSFVTAFRNYYGYTPGSLRRA